MSTSTPMEAVGLLALPGVASGQWRLSEVQLANWGTFDAGIYRIDIAREGHLITGASGSGKSSLLDAIAAVLTPDKWLRFNEAAQGAEARANRRSIVSYVRGAWTRTNDELEDRVVAAYLRPGATWSGIVLRFENEVDAPISLCRLFFAKGTGTTSADISDICILDRSALDLADLQTYARGGLQTRQLKKDRPDAVVTSAGTHTRFYVKMRSLFGIGDETALQLLHKTQSAKGLDSLDQLFREYMLERPGTFELAQTALAQFSELRDAHDHVVQLRLQRDHLVELREAAIAYDKALEAGVRTGRLIDGVLPFRVRRGLALARDELHTVEQHLIGLRSAQERAHAAEVSAEKTLTQARDQLSAAGGFEVSSLGELIESAEVEEGNAKRRWEQFAAQLAAVGIATAPTTAAEFAELLDQLDRAPAIEATGATYEEQASLADAKRRVATLEGEIESLRRNRSTVPSVLASVRRAVAEGVGLPTSALPFVAELIDVKPQFAEWEGAIERVLHSFALTMLVRSDHLPAVRRWVDGTTIPVRLVYEELRADAPAARPARSEVSLVNRVAVSDGAFAPWLQGQLSARYDVACVERADDLDAHDRAVTIRGQIRTRGRYEKDDRRRIDDRSNWVLGNAERKLDVLIDALTSAQRVADAAQAVVDAAERRRRDGDRRKSTLEHLRAQSWSDLDHHEAAVKVARLIDRRTRLTEGNADLAKASAFVATAELDYAEARDLHRDARDAARDAELGAASLREAVADLMAQVESGSVPDVDEPTWHLLDKRFRAVKRAITRSTIADVANEVLRRLQDERDTAQRAATAAAGTVTSLATQFRSQWESAAVDLRPDVEDRAGYVAILDTIVANGLPDHEATFFRLLRERSRDMIGELVSDILRAPQEIEERVTPVNASLRRSPFDDDRWLRLRVKLRRSETVKRFIDELRSISEGAWRDDDVDSAERRFTTMAEVMRRFGSSEHVDRVWRSQVLDTRQHVTFLAEEIDEHGRAHATYDSAATMSGGQQQKLVVFCLAAALRYQLADAEDVRPRYGTVILDEAFDKADTRYTRMALDVFREFGFHLVLATPHKLVQTIEPYIGGATTIENPTRCCSTAARIAWTVDSGPRGDAAAEVPS